MYKYCPLCGTALGEILEEDVTYPHCHGCKEFTHYDNPLSAAVAVVRKDGGLVFIKRKVQPCMGKHALPGGYINKNEGPREACVREVKEETGLDIEIVCSLAELRTPDHNLFIVFYLCDYVSGEFIAGSDAEEPRVYQFNELPADVAFPQHEQVIKDYVASARQVSL